MRVLVIGQEPQTQALLEGLLTSRLWQVTHCASTEEASRLLTDASPPYDYILVEPDRCNGIEDQLVPDGGGRQGRAPVVYLDWRGTEMPSRRGEGVYGLYPVPVGGDDSEDQWVFEYHAPCRKRPRP